MLEYENVNLIKDLPLSYEIALAIGSSPDLKEMLDHFLKTVVRKGNAFQGIIWLWNGNELEIASVAGFHANTIDGTAAGFPGQGLKTVLESGQTHIKTDQDGDFQEFCIPSNSHEKQVLLQPVGKLALIQISFSRANAQSKRLAGILAGLAPILDNAIQSCLNHNKLLTIERTQRRLSEMRFYDLANKLKFGIFFGNTEGHYFYVNDAFLKLFGFNSMRELEFSWESLFKDPVQKEYFIQELNNKAYVRGLVILAKHKNGEDFWVQVTASLGHFMDDQTLSVMGIVEDITERKQAEDALKTSESRLRLITDNMLDIVTQTDAAGIIRGGSHSGNNLLGYKPQDMQGKSIFNFVHPDDLDRTIAAFRTGIQANAGGRLEVRIRHAGGHYMWLEIFGRTLCDEQGALTGAVFGSRDITGRKQVEEALRKSEEQLQQSYEEEKQLLASISQTIIGVDAGGRITHWNAAAEKTFGIEAAKVIGRPFAASGIRWDWERFKEMISTGKTGDLQDEISFTRPDGKEGLLGFNINFTSFEPGRESGYILVGTEISERKIQEAQQVLSQKLESIGRLAAGIAHEINTPMQYIGDNARFLRNGFRDICKLIEAYSNALGSIEKDVPRQALAKIKEMEKQIDIGLLTAEIPQALDQSLDGIARVSKLVRAMKDFSHSGSRKRNWADINRAIEGTVTISRNEWKNVADLELDLQPDLPPVNCVIDEINQVVLNMIVNSAQAIAQAQDTGNGSEKGRITIGTKSGEDFVQISISDTGAGIPRSNMHRIFDPFFTTKEVGKGTGQGLAIAHDIIVNKHRGSIQVESSAGTGTTFIVHLPLKKDSLRG